MQTSNYSCCMFGATRTDQRFEARARQAGTRICQDEEVLRDSPVLARLVKRSPNELLCGTFFSFTFSF